MASVSGKAAAAGAALDSWRLCTNSVIIIKLYSLYPCRLPIAFRGMHSGSEIHECVMYAAHNNHSKDFVPTAGTAVVL